VNWIVQLLTALLVPLLKWWEGYQERKAAKRRELEVDAARKALGTVGEARDREESAARIADDTLAPQHPEVGQLWYDRNTNVLRRWNGVAWVKARRIDEIFRTEK